MRLLFCGILFAAFSTLASATVQNEPILSFPNLSKEGYVQIQNISRQLNELCPAPTCLQVYIGRSSTLITAYHEGQKLLNHTTLPISGLSSLKETEIFAVGKEFIKHSVKPHLLPKLETIQKVLIIDYVNNTGNSILYTSQWIKNFLQSQKMDIAVEAAHYGSPLPSSARLALEKSDIATHTLSCPINSKVEGEFAYFVKQEIHKNYAAFESWDPRKDSPNQALQNRSLRRPYPYRFKSNGPLPSRYASYNDLVEWFKNAGLKDTLPSSFAIHCTNMMNGSGNFVD